MLAKYFTQKDDIPQNSYVHFPERRKKLLEIENKISQLLALSDNVVLRVALATYAANSLKDIPVWIMIIAPPSSGKTEILGTMYELPETEVLSDITKSSLLSGVSTREKTENATGGLLLEMGDSGFLIFKDFTSLISLKKDESTNIMSALREVYDGDYSRHFGSDGGSSKKWHGRVGVIAAVTPAIEKHRSTFSTMGDRFLTVRMYDDEFIRAEQAKRALSSSGTEKDVRVALQELTASLFEDLEPEMVLPSELHTIFHNNISSLAQFVAHCRTPVEYSWSGKEVIQVHKPEGPGRLIKQLLALFKGCIAIGCSLQDGWLNTIRVAMDTIPEQRAIVLESLIKEGNDQVSTLSSLKKVTRLPYGVNRKIVEELYVLRILDASHSDSDRLKSFWLSDSAKKMINALSIQPKEPEDFSFIREHPILTTSLPENRKNVLMEMESEKESEVRDAG